MSKDQDPNDKRRTVSFELDMDRIIYARVKKVGESTVDIRFRDPRRSMDTLGIKPDDDFIVFPTPDRDDLIFTRVDKIVIRDNINKHYHGFISSDAIERIISTIEAGRQDFMRDVGRGRRVIPTSQKARRRSRRR
jgi:hypothetical protein